VLLSGLALGAGVLTTFSTDFSTAFTRGIREPRSPFQGGPGIGETPRRKGISRILRLLRRVARLGMGVALAGLLVLLGVAAVPRIFGYPTLVVTGGSMGEALPLGSIAITQTVSAGEVRKGDIVVTARENDGEEVTVAHRVERIDDEGASLALTTRGDENEAQDPVPFVAPKAQGVHKVIGHVPYAGYVIEFARTPLGWALVVLLPMSLSCIDVVCRIWARPGRSRATSGFIRVWRWAP
jgi:signal peptidase